jgi:quinolinate synthase
MDEISARILELKRKCDVEILAHYYQTLDVQGVADHIGDSLYLAMKARDSVQAKNIIFCAVRFMGETAAILNPTRDVYSPAPHAECPMAKQITPSMIELARKKYPGLPLVVYVNTTAETKAYADACCTSSNAIKIVDEIAKEWGVDTVIMAPDANLAANVGKKTKAKVIGYPETGCCPTHNMYSIDDVQKVRKEHPAAKLIVHPEVPSEVADLADYSGSTAQLLSYIENDRSSNGIIIGTEIEFIRMVSLRFPDKKFWPLNPRADCPNMKKITVENILRILEALDISDRGYLSKMKIQVDPEISTRAAKAIDKMVDLMKK